MKNSNSSLLKSIQTGLGVVLIIIVFSFAFQMTDVNFETIREEDRITQLHRVLRALAKPDLFERDVEEIVIQTPFYLPCPESGDMELEEVDQSGAYITANVSCASPGDMVTVNGYGFPANLSGPLSFFTQSGVKKPLGNFETDANGEFVMEVELPDRQPVDEAQHIIAPIRKSVGPLRWTDTSKATGVRIVETIFIALLATTVGTILSIPISFIAAKNLMRDSTSSLINVALSILGWPLGIFIGAKLTAWAIAIMGPIKDNLLFTIGGVLILVAVVYFLLKTGINADDTHVATRGEKIRSSIFIVLAVVLTVLALILFGYFTQITGKAIIEPLGAFGFLGNALYLLGDITIMLIPAIVALAVGAVVANIFNRFGQKSVDKFEPGLVKVLNIIFAAVAGALLFVLIMSGLNWFYQFNNQNLVFMYPAILGGLIGLIMAVVLKPKQPLPTGLLIYNVVRTILNATRSIEPLVMAIVAVIWVGIGPFAGSLALALHTVAALSKLYSEQVESIDDGPLEAIQATGANQLQTIIYAVIPQIVPPYISFTMYRWDINVRMSTIIGFVGGGGIGLLLSQNINLLQYRAASVQMIAIAIVVATMDYVSSKIRENVI